MRQLLKYLFPLFVAFFFCGCTDKSVRTVTEDIASAMLLEETACHSNVSESSSELCLPRQVSFANPHRVQNTSRRAAGAQRKNIEFTKSGKIINADIRYFVQRKSVLIHSSLMEPAHKLLYLGKLII